MASALNAVYLCVFSPQLCGRAAPAAAALFAGCAAPAAGLGACVWGMGAKRGRSGSCVFNTTVSGVEEETLIFCLFFPPPSLRPGVLRDRRRQEWHPLR